MAPRHRSPDGAAIHAPLRLDDCLKADDAARRRIQINAPGFTGGPYRELLADRNVLSGEDGEDASCRRQVALMALK